MRVLISRSRSADRRGGECPTSRQRQQQRRWLGERAGRERLVVIASSDLRIQLIPGLRAADISGSGGGWLVWPRVVR